MLASLFACACGNVWVCGFCFAFCNHSADHLLISCRSQPARQACSALLNYPERKTFHLSGFRLMRGRSPPSKQLPKTGLACILTPWVLQSCCHHPVAPRRSLHMGEGCKSWVLQKGAWLCEDRLEEPAARSSRAPAPASQRESDRSLREGIRLWHVGSNRCPF